MNDTTNEIGWVITRDLIGDGDRKGYGQSAERQQKTTDSFNAVVGRTVYVETGLSSELVCDPVKIRLKDDDGEIYYEGVIASSWLHGDEEQAFAPLRWAEADAGCVTMEYRGGLRWETL